MVKGSLQVPELAAMCRTTFKKDKMML